MARADHDWLSFSLMSSMDQMMNIPSSHHHTAASVDADDDDSQHFYSLADNFYATGWANQKAEVMYAEAENHDQLREQNSFSLFTGYMQPPPKLEDFFSAGGDSTDAHHDDSSLTHIYDQHHHAVGGSAYFSGGDHQDLKAFTGFQAFSANSGSEVDDSAFVGQTHESPVESGTELVAYSQPPPQYPLDVNISTHNPLSLGVNIDSNNHNNNNDNNNNINKNTAIIAADDRTAAGSCKKISDTFGQRTSIYRGVTSYTDGQEDTKRIYGIIAVEERAKQEKGVKLVIGENFVHEFLNICSGYSGLYISGGYDKEDKAARAYDLAALKYWGSSATTNFPISNYTKEIEEMKHATKQEFIASLRRKSSGFSRGASIYRGVTRHHQQGRWQARIGRVAGNKDLYLGTFATEEEAAEAYDIAAIKFRGINAVTNFEMNRYDVEAIAESPLPVGGTAKRLKLSLEEKVSLNTTTAAIQTPPSTISFSDVQSASANIPCGVPFDSTASFYHHNSFFHHLVPSNHAGSDPMVNPISMMSSAMSSTTPEFLMWPHQPY
ncbi:hypothetical protein OROMI_019059 [Orobanche minor]